MIGQFLDTAVFALVALGLAHYLSMQWRGVRAARRAVERPTIDAAAVGTATGPIGYVLVPCLDEALVIDATVTSLLASTDATIIVIDDDSGDGTGDVARAAAARAGACDRLVLVRRLSPDARRGKGAALNAGFAAVVDEVRARGLDAERVVLCVMDADGRLSEGAWVRALSSFEDPRIGGVQLGVRIRDRHRSLLLRMQDLEFWSLAATQQLSWSGKRCCALGGNGQFTRLSALLELGREPWTDSLTEDLELGLRLLVAGWQITTHPDVYVDQQGVTTLRRALRQRARWFQGHLECRRYASQVWRDPSIPSPVAFEVSAYLLVPFVLTLPWSLLVHYSVWHATRMLMQPSSLELLGSPALGTLAHLLAVYLVSFFPSMLAGAAYWRRDRETGLFRCLVYGHLMILYGYACFYAAWWAVLRSLRRSRGWSKTVRYAEPALR